MSHVIISEAVRYIGVEDKTLDLFESQYKVPHGVSYNSYVILDEKIAVMDTVDARKSEEWKANLEKELNGRIPDYLIISHMEPDHAANIQLFAELYPEAKLVISAKGASMLPQFFEISNLEERVQKVKEGDTLCLGEHTLQFFLAPMVHWPEVMVEYEQSEKILFSADGFGKFGTTDDKEPWDDEARRYYFNIVGKYGAQVQALLKKAATLEIEKICPLHGPVLSEDIAHYVEKYQTWSSYEAEEKGVVIAYASIHGNTGKAAHAMKDVLVAAGEKDVVVTDLARDDMSKAIEDAFRYDKLIIAGASYDGSVFPCMETFLRKLANKNYQNRKLGIIENGSWAPSAGRVMKGIVDTMKNITLCEKMVTIKSTVKEENVREMEALAEELLR